MSEKRTRTPQEKKALSYANDRRNSYSGNDKAARKAIPARKAEENRRARHKASNALDSVDRLDEADVDLVESSLRQDIERVGGWTKGADESLADSIGRRARRRTRRGLTPNRTSSDAPEES